MPLPRLPRHPRTPPPEGFWDQVREYHNQIWNDTEANRRSYGLFQSSADAWRHLDSENPKVRVGTVWRANRYFGGRIAIGKLNISRFIVPQVIAPPAEGESGEAPSIPVANTMYVYTLGRTASKWQPTLTVNRTMYDTGDRIGPTLSDYMADHRHGLDLPELPAYQEVLAELAIGAAGESRMAPPPD